MPRHSDTDPDARPDKKSTTKRAAKPGPKPTDKPTTKPGTKPTDKPAAKPGTPPAARRRSGSPTVPAPKRGAGAPAARDRRKAAERPLATPREQRPAAVTASSRDLLALYRADLERILADADTPAYRYDQVVEHLFKQPSLPFVRSTVLPGTLRTALDALGHSTLAVEASHSSRDRTTKLLLAAGDGAAIEMVVMRYRERVTACISSQVGCPVGCAFCATGRGGFERNLTVAEIVDQVRVATALVAEEGRRLSNLVFMGMGEPLLNLQAVLDSIRAITDPRGLNLGHRAISVSTVGIPAGIRRLGRAEPQVNLALSLHAADDRIRAQLIPETYRHPLARILEAAWDHFEITHRKLMVEYVLLEGINDSAADARRLAALLQGHVVTVNLLAWNPVGPRPRDVSRRPEANRPEARRQARETARDVGGTGSAAAASGETGGPHGGFRPSSPAAVVAFRDTLLKAGVEAVVRQSKGGGIDAACGQLAGRIRGRRRPQ